MQITILYIYILGLKGEYRDNHQYISANLRGLANCFQGSMEATSKKGLGFNKL